MYRLILNTINSNGQTAPQIFTFNTDKLSDVIADIYEFLSLKAIVRKQFGKSLDIENASVIDGSPDNFYDADHYANEMIEFSHNGNNVNFDINAIKTLIKDW